jgi:hypothetical protein
VRIIIAGSRDFNDYEYLKNNCNEVLSHYFLSGAIDSDLTNVMIISGNARGADALGERFARENRIGCKLFPANWESYGKSAGYRRNMEMAKYAKIDDGILIAFWDGLSRGTWHMINLAKKMGLQVFVFEYNKKQLLLEKGKIKC